MLTAAVSPSKKVIDEGYDVPLLNEYLDHINVMTYDFYGHWDKQTGHVAPLYHHPDAATFEFNAVRLLLTIPIALILSKFSEILFFVRRKRHRLRFKKINSLFTEGFCPI